MIFIDKYMFYLQFPDIYDAKIQTFTETTSQLQKKITRMLFLGILFFFKVPPLSSERGRG